MLAPARHVIVREGAIGSEESCDGVLDDGCDIQSQFQGHIWACTCWRDGTMCAALDSAARITHMTPISLVCGRCIRMSSLRRHRPAVCTRCVVPCDAFVSNALIVSCFSRLDVQAGSTLSAYSSYLVDSETGLPAGIWSTVAFVS
jgi:hypothetical protein